MLIPSDVARAVRRTTTTFVLNWIDARQRAMDLDPLEFLIVHTIAAANLQHLPNSQRAGLSDPEAGEERHPVSIEGVAAALNVSSETVRRRLKALVARGLVERMGPLEDDDGERSASARASPSTSRRWRTRPCAGRSAWSCRSCGACCCR